MKPFSLHMSHAVSLMVGAFLIASAPYASAGNSWTSTNFGSQCTLSSGAPVPGQPGWTSCGVPDPTFKGFSTGTGTSASPQISSTYVAATVYDWNSSGLGIVNSNESSGSTGPHAFDNYNGNDAMVFQFSNGAVSLTSVTIGWNGHDNPKTTTSSGVSVNYKDSDLALWAWTGGAGDPTSLADFGPASGGWSLIGDYYNVGKMAGNTAAISTTTYSSYWLVTTVGTGTASSTDSFKLLALAGKGCATTISGTSCVPNPPVPATGVPEPGSLALLAGGLLGMAVVRHRRQRLR